MTFDSVLRSAAATGASIALCAASMLAQPTAGKPAPVIGKASRYINPLPIETSSRDGSPQGVNLGDVTVLVVDVRSGDPLDVSDRLKQKHAPAVVIVGARDDGAAQLLINLDKSLEGRGVDAGAVIREAAVLIGGKGGGRATMARAGGKEPERLEDAVALAEKTIIEALI